jgi:predicted nucleic acid-binding protein
MSVLVDTSIWIEYFRGSGYLFEMDFLIGENLLATNDLILAELIPYLHVQKQKRLIHLMLKIERKLLNIDWQDIIQMQVTCLTKGINGVGIPDLVISQHAMQNNYLLFAQDKHFQLISEQMPLILYGAM